MITNIPSAESLNEIALRLYFSAWSLLVEIKSDFDMAYPPGSNLWGEDWDEEWTEYLIASQPDIQSVRVLIQQSNELALRAKICSINPFLLLLGSERRLSTTPKNVDFSEFRTIDALELPSAVNTFCSDPLSDKFIQSYNEIRSLRNKIAHLGHVNKQFKPQELLHTLVKQYLELWRQRHWLRDRVMFASQTRLAFFHDGRHSSAENEVMYELPYNMKLFSKSEFKLLFGHEKGAKRYLCHACIYNASTAGEAPGDMRDCKTAFLDKKGKNLHCVMCGDEFRVARARCNRCGDNVIGDNTDDYAGQCHVCGEEDATA